MAQKGQEQEGISCGEVRVVCGFHAQGSIAPYPYIWQQHVANQEVVSKWIERIERNKYNNWQEQI